MGRSRPPPAGGARCGHPGCRYRPIPQESRRNNPPDSIQNASSDLLRPGGPAAGVPKNPFSVNELTRLSVELQDFCDRRQWKFCIIGGIAVLHWGEPRFTMDLDLTLLTGCGGEESFVDEWLSHYEPRIEGARDFALMNRVLLLRSGEGIGIDIAPGNH